LYVSPDDALEIIPALPDIYDEPFGDSSQIPTSLVSKLTRQYVVVSLSGDAGDELFGGYNRYVWSNGVWNGISLTPLLIRRALAASIAAISPQSWDRVHDFLKPVLPHQLKQRILGDKMHKMAGMLDAGSYAEMYRHQVSTWKDTGIIIDDAPEPSTALTDNNNMLNTRDFVQQMMYLDLVSYLPDDILTKVDRASMSVSLETRVPFLDHRVVEFAWKLPLSLKIRNGQGKWILRQVLYKYLPKELVERPKMGFGVPIDAWLRGPLREWAEDLLSEDRLLKEGFLNPKPIRALWNEHLGGRRNWHHQLWNVLMFESWIEKTV
jgi:asparagine synthase (glutamine-hydrolysing)